VGDRRGGSWSGGGGGIRLFISQSIEGVGLCGLQGGGGAGAGCCHAALKEGRKRRCHSQRRKKKGQEEGMSGKGESCYQMVGIAWVVWGTIWLVGG